MPIEVATSLEVFGTQGAVDWVREVEWEALLVTGSDMAI